MVNICKYFSFCDTVDIVDEEKEKNAVHTVYVKKQCMDPLTEMNLFLVRFYVEP